MSKIVNVALFGAGFWGENIARAFYQLGVLKVVCDPSEEVCRVKKEKYPDIEISTSFTGTIARKDIEGLVIATPAAMHYSAASAIILKDSKIK